MDFNSRVKALGKETKFEWELSQASSAITTIRMAVLLLESFIKARDIIETISFLNYASRSLNKVHDFFLKYDDFFGILDKKFGTSTMKCSKSSNKIVGGMKRQVEQLLLFVSEKKFETMKGILTDFIGDFKRLEKSFSVISTLPYTIDYSKLSNKDWRMIGVAGLHYRSKVFLSYCFRDVDPKKDENQKLIDYYVKPTFKLLNIEPVTARGYLKPQQLIDDEATELIEDCDGIIGFYTEDDSIENVEHELSKNPNIVAICREIGGKAPSMRRSRLLINFKRDQTGDFLIQLIDVLKSKGLFRLVV